MDEAEHRRAFDDLPDMRHESPEYGMLGPETPWEPPDGDVVLERVPDFDQSLNMGDQLVHRVRTNVRWSVVSHSPDGFEFSYGGSGPADLSLNILNMFCPPWTDNKEPVQCFEGEASATAWDLHQEFKRAVVANAPWEGGTLSGTKIREWIEDRSREVQE